MSLKQEAAFYKRSVTGAYSKKRDTERGVVPYSSSSQPQRSRLGHLALYMASTTTASTTPSARVNSEVATAPKPHETLESLLADCEARILSSTLVARHELSLDEDLTRVVDAYVSVDEHRRGYIYIEEVKRLCSLLCIVYDSRILTANEQRSHQDKRTVAVSRTASLRMVTPSPSGIPLETTSTTADGGAHSHAAFHHRSVAVVVSSQALEDSQKSIAEMSVSIRDVASDCGSEDVSDDEFIPVSQSLTYRKSTTAATIVSPVLSSRGPSTAAGRSLSPSKSSPSRKEAAILLSLRKRAQEHVTFFSLIQAMFPARAELQIVQALMSVRPTAIPLLFTNSFAASLAQRLGTAALPLPITVRCQQQDWDISSLQASSVDPPEWVLHLASEMLRIDRFPPPSSHAMATSTSKRRSMVSIHRCESEHDSGGGGGGAIGMISPDEYDTHHITYYQLITTLCHNGEVFDEGCNIHTGVQSRRRVPAQISNTAQGAVMRSPLRLDVDAVRLLCVETSDELHRRRVVDTTSFQRWISLRELLVHCGLRLETIQALTTLRVATSTFTSPTSSTQQETTIPGFLSIRSLLVDWEVVRGAAMSCIDRLYGTLSEQVAAGEAALGHSSSFGSYRPRSTRRLASTSRLASSTSFRGRPKEAPPPPPPTTTTHKKADVATSIMLPTMYITSDFEPLEQQSPTQQQHAVMSGSSSGAGGDVVKRCDSFNKSDNTLVGRRGSEWSPTHSPVMGILDSEPTSPSIMELKRAVSESSLAAVVTPRRVFMPPRAHQPQFEKPHKPPPMLPSVREKERLSQVVSVLAMYGPQTAMRLVWDGLQPTFPPNVVDTLSNGNNLIDCHKWRPLGDVGLSAAVRLSLETAVPVGKPTERRHPIRPDGLLFSVRQLCFMLLPLYHPSRFTTQRREPINFLKSAADAQLQPFMHPLRTLAVLSDAETLSSTTSPPPQNKRAVLEVPPSVRDIIKTMAKIHGGGGGDASGLNSPSGGGALTRTQSIRALRSPTPAASTTLSGAHNSQLLLASTLGSTNSSPDQVDVLKQLRVPQPTHCVTPTLYLLMSSANQDWNIYKAARDRFLTHRSGGSEGNSATTTSPSNARGGRWSGVGGQKMASSAPGFGKCDCEDSYQVATNATVSPRRLTLPHPGLLVPRTTAIEESSPPSSLAVSTTSSSLASMSEVSHQQVQPTSSAIDPSLSLSQRRVVLGDFIVEREAVCEDVDVEAGRDGTLKDISNIHDDDNKVDVERDDGDHSGGDYAGVFNSSTYEMSPLLSDPTTPAPSPFLFKSKSISQHQQRGSGSGVVALTAKERQARAMIKAAQRLSGTNHIPYKEYLALTGTIERFHVTSGSHRDSTVVAMHPPSGGDVPSAMDVTDVDEDDEPVSSSCIQMVNASSDTVPGVVVAAKRPSYPTPSRPGSAIVRPTSSTVSSSNREGPPSRPLTATAGRTYSGLLDRQRQPTATVTSSTRGKERSPYSALLEDGVRQSCFNRNGMIVPNVQKKVVRGQLVTSLKSGYSHRALPGRVALLGDGPLEEGKAALLAKGLPRQAARDRAIHTRRWSEMKPTAAAWDGGAASSSHLHREPVVSTGLQSNIHVALFPSTSEVRGAINDFLITRDANLFDSDDDGGVDDAANYIPPRADTTSTLAGGVDTLSRRPRLSKFVYETQDDEAGGSDVKSNLLLRLGTRSGTQNSAPTVQPHRPHSSSSVSKSHQAPAQSRFDTHFYRRAHGRYEKSEAPYPKNVAQMENISSDEEDVTPV